MPHLYWRGPYKGPRIKGKRYPGDTAWVVAYIKGKRQKPYSLKTKDPETAKYLINQIENELLERQSINSPIRRAGTPINEVMNHYIEDIEDTIGKQQLNEEKAQLNKLIEYTNIKTLPELDLRDVKQFLKSRMKAKKDDGTAIPISDRTKNGYIVTFKKFCKFGRREGYLKDDPLLSLKQKKLTKNDPEWLNEKDEEKLLQYAKKTNSDYYPLICTGIYEGLRIAELLHLEWQNFTWSNGNQYGTIHVRNKEQFKTKSRSYRVIPLAKGLEEILKSYRKKAGYCFFPEDPHRLQYKTHRQKFKKLCAAAGVKLPEGKAFHILRHTFGTKHGRAGRSIYKLAEWLGHSSVETTKKYSHLRPDDREIDLV